MKIITGRQSYVLSGVLISSLIFAGLATSQPIGLIKITFAQTNTSQTNGTSNNNITNTTASHNLTSGSVTELVSEIKALCKTLSGFESSKLNSAECNAVGQNNSTGGSVASLSSVGKTIINEILGRCGPTMHCKPGPICNREPCPYPSKNIPPT